MDDIKVFQDLIKPKFEIKEVHMDEEGSDTSLLEEDHGDSQNHKDKTSQNENIEENPNPKQNSEVEKNFQFDEDDTKFGIEQLGTLLSAFLQDDSGRNVVDAVVQNSKWQRNICRVLEKISDQLEARTHD